ncbi:MAG: HNH endonuclease [Mesorhizobium sp.]|uniref:HNH endonuclease n=1 Tax=Mesorhizobium sp. TaxID=1871066 RepID=UPI000FE76488|nr:HNH endonuclease [Mesorhizobium sp.]RWD45172.1 MAG: HNH endonuclease [Mesorhizobium sp.]RWE52716.1 MAG: HNH endonuclease [Mesorhizobium sp.]RWF07410.1 MAG: HNH endonuclease [Mesorhizobium sp.]RWF18637.1 MAG: HNH endonuclease [Mesorhizobium sp.]TIW49979.1 MAG: HNH endonuclease [Mesorhizobium sp.]
MYPSKAIAGAAHGFLEDNSQPLRADEFSGGDGTVAQKLRSLGFEVRSTTRNPDWSRDELILALDFYLKNPQSPPGNGSNEVGTLSQQLNMLNAVLGQTGGESFRNANGVYMKVMNFRRFDPSFSSVGKVGLSHGGAQDEAVWNEFASDPVRLEIVASAIRSALVGGVAPVAIDELDYVEEAEEGRLLTALHRRRERSQKLVRACKDKAMNETGELRCEACNMSFLERYGEFGNGFMEVHHIRPLHTLGEGHKTLLTDLALVCSNCHRMIHRRKQWLTVAELARIINRSGVSTSL